MVPRMDFKRPYVGLFDGIRGEKSIFVIKSKDFHVEMPFFFKKEDISRRGCVDLNCCDLNKKGNIFNKTVAH